MSLLSRVAAVVGTALSVTSVAQADTLKQTITLSGLGDKSAVAALFDSNLGTLYGVDLFGTLSATGTASITPFVDRTDGTLSTSAFGSFKSSNYVVNQALASITTQGYSQLRTGNVRGYDVTGPGVEQLVGFSTPTVSAHDQASFSNPVLFADYLAAYQKTGGGALDITASLTRYFDYTARFKEVDIVEDSFINTATLTISYFYVPKVVINPVPAVPEPATWAMMLIGFAATGFAMRRHQKDGLSVLGQTPAPVSA